MEFNIAQNIAGEMQSIQVMLLFINALLHLLFAGAVAKDAGNLHKRGRQTHLVSSVTWAFATLTGGPLVAGVYWFMHHMRTRH
jgi:hypothetical protein